MSAEIKLRIMVSILSISVITLSTLLIISDCKASKWDLRSLSIGATKNTQTYRGDSNFRQTGPGVHFNIENESSHPSLQITFKTPIKWVDILVRRDKYSAKGSGLFLTDQDYFKKKWRAPKYHLTSENTVRVLRLGAELHKTWGRMKLKANGGIARWESNQSWCSAAQNDPAFQKTLDCPYGVLKQREHGNSYWVGYGVEVFLDRKQQHAISFEKYKSLGRENGIVSSGRNNKGIRIAYVGYF